MRPSHLRDNCRGEKEANHEVFDELVYKPSWFDLDSIAIKDVVDVGALIGSFTLWAHEQWPNATIHAYEPDPESFDYLKKNIQMVNSDKITAYNLGVWGNDEKLAYHRFENTPGNNTVVYDQRPFTEGKEEQMFIKPRKIIDVIKEIGGKIDFLKLDCEGSEYNILYSLSKSELKKIKFIAVEYHEFDNNPRNRGKSLSIHLRKNGFITQMIPTNIKSRMGLGYIYGTRIHHGNQILRTVFDDEYSRLKNIRKTIDETETYVKDLEKTIKIKDEVSS